MTSSTKSCPYCSEEILATAIKCKHCKSDLEREIVEKPKESSNLAIFVSVLIVLIVAIVAMDSENYSTSTVSQSSNIQLPASQSNFISLVEGFMSPYREAGSNELAKSQQRLLRKQSLQANVTSLSFDNWIGRISDTGTTGDGNAFVTIDLENTDIALQTTNNEFSDSFADIKTLIPIGSSLFSDLMNLESRERVTFSGRLVDSSDDDYISIIHITERSAMLSPSFLVRIDSIRSYEQPSEVVAEAPTEVAPEPVETLNGIYELTFGISPREAGEISNDVIRCRSVRNESASCFFNNDNEPLYLSFHDQEVDRQNCCVGVGGSLQSIYRTMGQYTSASADLLLERLGDNFELLIEPTAAQRSQWRAGNQLLTYFYENTVDPERTKYIQLKITANYFDLFGNLKQDMDVYYLSNEYGAEVLEQLKADQRVRLQ